MWLYYVLGGGALLGGGAIAVAASKKKAAVALPVAAAQAQAAQVAAAQGGPAVPLQTAPIQPPGIPQPRGVVSLPAPPIPSASLTQSARVLLTYLATNTPGKGSVPQVKSFQTAYNMSGPTTALKPDGIYGPKCQAALQSTVGSAPVPGHVIPVTVSAAPPSIPAAKPVSGFDVTAAAAILANMAATQSGSFFPKTSDKRVSTFQAAYNTMPGVLHLAVDGKYGAATQAALQSVLNWMGTGMQAPNNPFSGPPKTIPTFVAPVPADAQALGAMASAALGY